VARLAVDLTDRSHNLPHSGFKKGDTMKYLFAAALVAATVAGIGGASAEDHCGPGMHRNMRGFCRPNAVVVVPGAVVVERPVVVERGRGCPMGMAWRYGRCRPI